MTPITRRLTEKAERIRIEVLSNRAGGGDLSLEARIAAEGLSLSLVERLIHEPLGAIQEAETTGQAGEIDLAVRLFKLKGEE